MPQRAFISTIGAEDDTVKTCPPFVDAMTTGFIIPLICDVHVCDGEFTWDYRFPSALPGAFPRSPMSFHDGAQVLGTPLFNPDRNVVKWHNFWTIEAPPGYSLLFTHPANRLDLPFTTLSGWVDADRYHSLPIHFPAHWRDPDFAGVLPRGTPIAQCVSLKRETWTSTIATISEDEAQAAQDLMGEIKREPGVYRRQFRA